MGEDRDWSWVDEEGVEHPLTEDELTLALSSEEIPAFGLVRRQGWAEWLPAMQVAELRWALPPGQADVPRKARTSPRKEPVPPPIGKYPLLKKRARDILDGKIDPKMEVTGAFAVPVRPSQKSSPSVSLSQSSPRNPRGSEAQRMPSSPSLPGLSSPLAVRQSRPELDLLDPESEPPRTTRAPHPAGEGTRGKTPVSSSEAARQGVVSIDPELDSVIEVVGESDLGDFSEEKTRIQQQGVGELRDIEPHLFSTRSVALGARQQLDSSVEARAKSPVPPAARPMTPVPARARQSLNAGNGSAQFQSDALSAVVQPTPSPPAPSIVGVSLPPDFRRPARSKLAGLIGVLVLFLGGVAWFATRSFDAEEVEVTPAPTTPPTPTAPPEPSTRCQVGSSPERLFEFAKPEIRPVFLGTGSPRHVLLGYAQTSRMAIGMRIEAATLSAEIVFREEESSPLLSVSPVRATTEPPEFRAERAASTLQAAQTIRATPPFSFGLRQKALAVRRNRKDRDLWESPWETISVPVTIRVGPEEHVVAFRGGGQRGSILYGKLSEQGKAIGELLALQVPAARLGEPDLAATSERVAMVLDGGATASLGRLYGAVSRLPELPTKARSLELGEGPLSEPSIVGLPDGGFFLQWSEGSVGKQRIVGRILDDSLAPQEEPLALSPQGSDAHHGVSAFAGNRIIAVYFVRAGNNNELWATTLSCKTAAR